MIVNFVIFAHKSSNKMTRKVFVFILFLIHYIIITHAQENYEIKAGIHTTSPKNWDTTSYTSYSHKLNIYTGYSRLNYNIDMFSSFTHPYKYPTNLSYTTFTPLNYSFGFSYDKISLGFGFAKKYTYDINQTKPKTEYKAFTFSFGGNKFIIEPYFVKFKGFYDSNSPNNDTLFKKTGRYYSNPSLMVTSLKINGIYFLNNKRFAYRALSGFTYRQMKSRGSWIIVANGYYTQMHSDSILYSKPVELAYDSIKTLRSFTIYGGNIGGGYGHNFAMGKKKRFFLGFTLAAMIGVQQKQMYLKDSITINETKAAAGFDVRMAAGWTTDKFFAIAYVSADRITTSYLKIQFIAYTVPVSLTIGFRFNVKPPRPYRWFMNTKLYRWL